MKLLFVVFTIANFTATFASAQARGTQKPPSTVVAQVGNRTITLGEFNRKFNDVSKSVNPPTRAAFLEELVRFELGLIEAEKNKIAQDPLVQERIEQELYKSQLEREIGKQISEIKISDKELENFYKKNPELRFSFILIEVKSGATASQRAEAKDRAEKILSEVRSSKRPFEELVKLYTDDTTSKPSGGDAGWHSRITLAPYSNIYENLTQMKLNEIRGLLETPFGFQIIKLTGQRSFENASRRNTRMAYIDERRKQLFDNYFERLKKIHPVKTFLKDIE